jgi:hypothetical protein
MAVEDTLLILGRMRGKNVRPTQPLLRLGGTQLYEASNISTKMAIKLYMNNLLCLKIFNWCRKSASR